MAFVRPVQLECPQCGQTGVTPRVRKHETSTQISEEAVWSCHRCGSYFKRGVISLQEKKQPEQKKNQ